MTIKLDGTQTRKNYIAVKNHDFQQGKIGFSFNSVIKLK